MRSSITRHMQAAIMASHIGEPVMVTPPKDRSLPVSGRAIFSTGPTVRGGPEGATIISSADTFTFFKHTDSALAEAVKMGSTIERVETGKQFIVDSVVATNEHELVVAVMG